MEGNKTGTIETRESFGDCQLHVEWCTPAKVEGHSLTKFVKAEGTRLTYPSLL